MNEFTDLDLRLRVKQRVSQRLVAEEAGGFAQDLQVHAVVVFGNEQAEEQLDGTAVGRIKGEWRGGPQKDGGGFGDALDAAVGKRAAAAEAGGTEFFACEERVEGLRVGKTSGGFEDEARLFVEALAAHDVEVKANGFKSKQRCEKIHDASDGLVGPSNRKLRSVYQRGGEVRACGGSEPRECLRRCGTWRPCGGRWAHPASEAFRRAFRPKGGLWGPRSR